MVVTCNLCYIDIYCTKDNYKNYGYYRRLEDQIIGWYLCSKCDYNQRSKKLKIDKEKRNLSGYGIREGLNNDGKPTPTWKSWFDENWDRMNESIPRRIPTMKNNKSITMSERNNNNMNTINKKKTAYQMIKDITYNNPSSKEIFKRNFKNISEDLNRVEKQNKDEKFKIKNYNEKFMKWKEEMNNSNNIVERYTMELILEAKKWLNCNKSSIEGKEVIEILSMFKTIDEMCNQEKYKETNKEEIAKMLKKWGYEMFGSKEVTEKIFYMVNKNYGKINMSEEMKNKINIVTPRCNNNQKISKNTNNNTKTTQRGGNRRSKRKNLRNENKDEEEKILKCYYINARSINNKKTNLEIVIENLDLDLIFIDETNIKSITPRIDTHRWIKTKRDDEKGGGIAMMVKKELKPLCKKIEGKNENILNVEMSLNRNKKIYFITIYGFQENEKIEKVEKFYKDLQEIYETIII